MKYVLIVLLIFPLACFGESGKSCIKPKYTRAALMDMYLSKLHPETSDSIARSRIDQKTWKVIDQYFFEIYLCLRNTKDRIGCPDIKKGWDKMEHDITGNTLINALWQNDNIKTTEKNYFMDKLRFIIEESECDDF